MNTRFVGKGVGANNRFVRLDRHAGNLANQLRGRHDLRRIHAGFNTIAITTGSQDHDDLLQRSVAGPLAQAIDRALHLAGTVFDSRQRIGNGQTQIVMTMHREDGLIGIGNSFNQLTDAGAELVRRHISHGVWDIDHSSPRCDGGFDNTAEKVHLGTAGILGRKLHLRHQRTSQPDS